MPELDAERRNQLAAVLAEHTYDYPDSFCGCGKHFDRPWFEWQAHVADALAPLVAGWIAEERERARFNDEVRREQIRMARADALREAADNIHEVSGHSAGVPVWRSQVADWLNDRADRGGDDG